MEINELLNKIFRRHKTAWIFAGIILISLLACLKIISNAPDPGTTDGNGKLSDSTIVLNEGNAVSQEFFCEDNVLRGIEIYFKPNYSVQDSGLVEVSLEDADSNVYTWDFDKYAVPDTYGMQFFFDQELTGCKGEKFTIRISGEDDGCEACLYDESIKPLGSRLLVNEESTSGSIAFQTVSKNVSLTQVKLIFSVIMVMAAVFLFLLMKKRMSAETAFVFFYIAVAAASLVIVQPLSGNDEGNHFRRSYETSELSFITPSEGYKLPVTLQRYCLTIEKSVKGNPNKIYIREKTKDLSIGDSRVSVSFFNTSMYAPTNYLVPAAGIAITRFFTKNVGIIYYGGRIFSTIIYGIILYAAIALIPTGKWLLFILSIVPNSMLIFNSYSADSLCIACMFLLLSLVMKWIYEKDRAFTARDYAALYILAVFLSLSKLAYIPAVLMLFLLPKKKFKSKKNYWLNAAAAGTLCTILYFSWLKNVTPYTEISEEFVRKYLGQYVDYAKQTARLIQDPLHFLYLIIEDFNKNSGYLWDIFEKSTISGFSVSFIFIFAFWI